MQKMRHLYPLSTILDHPYNSFGQKSHKAASCNNRDAAMKNALNYTLMYYSNVSQ